MVETVSPTRSRRLPFWAILVALVVCVLGGVFVLLWIKLPTWAPEWVVEHSPWVDPIVRAVELESWHGERASERFAEMGASVVPHMLTAIRHPDIGVYWLPATVFTRTQDERSIGPMFERILEPERPSDPTRRTSAPPAHDIWVEPLRHQHPATVTDHLLRYLHPGIDIPTQLLDVAGGIDDERLIPVLKQLLYQPAPRENLKEASLTNHPTIRAAKALAESPSASAIPVLVESFTNPDHAIRLRILCGILLTTNEGGRYRTEDWDKRLRDLIMAGTTDGDSRVRQVAATCLGLKEFASAEDLLLQMSHADDPGERGAAVFGLRMGKPGSAAQDRIITLLRDPDEYVCQQAVYATRLLDDPSAATGQLLDLISSSSYQLREVVCSSLSRKQHLSDPRVFPAMIQAMEDPSESVARRAEQTAWFVARTAEQKAVVEVASAQLKRRLAGSAGP